MSRPDGRNTANGDDMTTSAFDNLIRNAAPPVPDPGPSRRQLRTVLHARMWRVRRRAARRHRWGVALAAALTFVMVYGAHQPKLGSDDLSFERTESLQINENESYRWIESPVRGKVTAVPEGTSDEQIRQMQEAHMIGGQPAEAIKGWSLDGTTPDWKIEFSYLADGKRFTSARKPESINVPLGVPQRGLIPFFMSEAEDFLDRVEKGTFPGQPYGRIMADGIIFEVYYYEQSYADIGTVRYYRGLPVSDGR